MTSRSERNSCRKQRNTVSMSSSWVMPPTEVSMSASLASCVELTTNETSTVTTKMPIGQPNAMGRQRTSGLSSSATTSETITMASTSREGSSGTGSGIGRA